MILTARSSPAMKFKEFKGSDLLNSATLFFKGSDLLKFKERANPSLKEL